MGLQGVRKKKTHFRSATQLLLIFRSGWTRAAPLWGPSLPGFLIGVVGAMLG